MTKALYNVEVSAFYCYWFKQLFFFWFRRIISKIRGTCSTLLRWSAASSMFLLPKST